ncbi:MAG: hypothetical protein NT080_06835 [Spirochaetes bacterium]|nr:hypothetical protein [Spirochaetota bacterium]
MSSRALFNDRILVVMETTKVSTEVSLEYGGVSVRSATDPVNDRITLTRDDDHKVAAFFLNGALEYANLFEFSKYFELSDSMSLLFGLLNELGWSEEIAEGIALRIGVETDLLGSSLLYKLDIAPIVGHGLSLNLSFILE